MSIKRCRRDSPVAFHEPNPEDTMTPATIAIYHSICFALGFLSLKQFFDKSPAFKLYFFGFYTSIAMIILGQVFLMWGLSLENQILQSIGSLFDFTGDGLVIIAAPFYFIRMLNNKPLDSYIKKILYFWLLLYAIAFIIIMMTLFNVITDEGSRKIGWFLLYYSDFMLIPIFIAVFFQILRKFSHTSDFERSLTVWTLIMTPGILLDLVWYLTMIKFKILPLGFAFTSIYFAGFIFLRILGVKSSAQYS